MARTMRRRQRSLGRACKCRHERRRGIQSRSRPCLAPEHGPTCRRTADQPVGPRRPHPRRPQAQQEFGLRHAFETPDRLDVAVRLVPRGFREVPREESNHRHHARKSVWRLAAASLGDRNAALRENPGLTGATCPMYPASIPQSQRTRTVESWAAALFRSLLVRHVISRVDVGVLLRRTEEAEARGQ